MTAEAERLMTLNALRARKGRADHYKVAFSPDINNSRAGEVEAAFPYRRSAARVANGDFDRLLKRFVTVVSP
jgi:hypothetical protein